MKKILNKNKICESDLRKKNCITDLRCEDATKREVASKEKSVFSQLKK